MIRHEHLQKEEEQISSGDEDTSTTTTAITSNNRSNSRGSNNSNGGARTKKAKKAGNNVRTSQMMFATDITQGLITEVRKLQLTLQEKEQVIKELEIIKADHEKEKQVIQKHLRQKNDIEEKLKEENWNLEVTNQDLQTQLQELNQTISKVNTEHTKVLKQLRSASEQAEIFKAQQEKATSTMEAMKARHDHEQQSLRRSHGTLHREMVQLKKKMDEVNTELKICKAKLAIKSTVDNKNNNNNTHQLMSNNHNNNTNNNDNNNDINNNASALSTDQGHKQQEKDTSESSTTLAMASQRALEMDTLKQSLAHAHRMISSLRSNLQKEKVEKIELKKLLVDAQEAVEQLQKDTFDYDSKPNNNSNISNSHKNNGSLKKSRNKVVRKRGGGSSAGGGGGNTTKKATTVAAITSAKPEKLSIVSSGDSVDPSASEEEDEETGNDDENEELRPDLEQDRESDMSSDRGSNDENDNDDDGNDDSDKDCDHHRLELSPITQGKSLDMELQLGGFGSSFKPLSSELQDSFANNSKPQYVDKGINTIRHAQESVHGQQHAQTQTAIVDEKTVVGNSVSLVEQQQQKQEKQAQAQVQVQEQETRQLVEQVLPAFMHSPSGVDDKSLFVTSASPHVQSQVQVQECGQALEQYSDVPSHAHPHPHPLSTGSSLEMQHSPIPSSLPKTARVDTTEMISHHEGMATPLPGSPLLQHQKQSAHATVPDLVVNTPVINKISDEDSQSCTASVITAITTAAATTTSTSTTDPTASTVVDTSQPMLSITEEHAVSLPSSVHISQLNSGNEQTPPALTSLNDTNVNVTSTAIGISVGNHSIATPASDFSHSVGKPEDQQHFAASSEVRSSPNVTNESLTDSTGSLTDAVSRDTTRPLDTTTSQRSASSTQVPPHFASELNTKEQQTNESTAANQKALGSHLPIVVVENGPSYVTPSLSISSSSEPTADDAGADDNRESAPLREESIITESQTHDNPLVTVKADNEAKSHGDLGASHVISQQDELGQMVIVSPKQRQQQQQETLDKCNEEKEKSQVAQADEKIDSNDKSDDNDSNSDRASPNLDSVKVEVDEKQTNLTSTTCSDDTMMNEAITVAAADSLDQPLRNDTATTIAIGEKEEGEGEEEYDNSNMISREEAEALIKAGIADALAKERLEAAARRQQEDAEFITRSEAEGMARMRLDEALKKERDRTSTMLTQAQADALARKYAEQAILEEQNKRLSQERQQHYHHAHHSQQLAHHPGAHSSPAQQQQQQHHLDVKPSSSSFLSRIKTSPSQSSLSAHRAASRRTSHASIGPTPEPSTSTSSTATTASSSSRLGILSGLMKLQPSISTPAKTNRLRPSASSSSLRRTTTAKSSSSSSSLASQHLLSPQRQPSVLSQHRRAPAAAAQTSTAKETLDRHLHLPSSPSYGTVQITETSMYSRRLSSSGSKQQQLLRQPSLQSFSTVASSDTYEHSITSPSVYSSSDMMQQQGQHSSAELISAITQTMIGEWMWKHTRKHVGGGISVNRHKRFFWVHPYTRTLYWSSTEPGMDADEAKAKSAFIESVSSIPSNDTMGASPLSLLIKTAKRDLKLTAPSLERHELWRMSLSYLLVPPAEEPMAEDVIQVDPYHDTGDTLSPTGSSSTYTLPIITKTLNEPDNLDEVDDDKEHALEEEIPTTQKHDSKVKAQDNVLTKVDSDSAVQEDSLHHDDVQNNEDDHGSDDKIDDDDVDDDDDEDDDSMDDVVNVRKCCDDHDVATLSRH